VANVDLDDMAGLGGMKVVILEARLSEELGNLLRRQGADPVCVPALSEEACSCEPELQVLLKCLATAEPKLVIFPTGVAVHRLFAEAAKLGRSDELRAGLLGATTVARGPKPAAALTKAQVQISVKVPEPFTTADLIKALERWVKPYLEVAVLHHGERNAPLVDWLTSRKARVLELMLYQWKLPADTAPLERLVGEIIAGRVPAIAFTSQIQARHLFQIAARNQRQHALTLALRTQVIVAAIGPTCAEVLTELGVTPDVVPAHPKMGSMVLSLASHVASRRGASRGVIA
jgi:uroporphyrinogen-III synthase